MSGGQSDSGAEALAVERKRKWMVRSGWALMVVAIISLTWTQILYPHYPARYKLTIEVETPQGLKTGSSVIEPVYGWEPSLFGLTRGRDNSITGEAVFVDLGAGRNLVVTLTNSSSGRSTDPNKTTGVFSAMDLPSGVYGFSTYHKSETRKGIKAAKKSGPRQVPLVSLPTTVTLTDLADLRTMRRVDTRDIAATFGPGYKLIGATIEMTDEPLTSQIRKHIPQLRTDCGSLTGIAKTIVCSASLKKMNGKL